VLPLFYKYSFYQLASEEKQTSLKLRLTRDTTHQFNTKFDTFNFSETPCWKIKARTVYQRPSIIFLLRSVKVELHHTYEALLS